MIVGKNHTAEKDSFSWMNAHFFFFLNLIYVIGVYDRKSSALTWEG